MYGYPLVIERDGEFFLGTLPDWPECNPIGSTEDELIADALRSIEEMAVARIEDRELIPLPRAGVAGPAVRLPLLTLLKLGLYMSMRDKGWRKADLARAMHVNQKSVDRLLDLNHASRLDQLESAFVALGVYPDVRLPQSGVESSHHRDRNNSPHRARG